MDLGQMEKILHGLSLASKQTVSPAWGTKKGYLIDSLFCNSFTVLCWHHYSHFRTFVSRLS